MVDNIIWVQENPKQIWPSNTHHTSFHEIFFVKNVLIYPSVVCRIYLQIRPREDILIKIALFAVFLNFTTHCEDLWIF